MKYFAAVLAIVLLSGCSVISGKVAPKVASAVNRYCQEPYSERQLIREEVNKMTAPHLVRVSCAGDPDNSR